MQVKIQDIDYEILENKNSCFDKSLVEEKFTDYFFDYDYIIGDFAYNKLRLKGFCDKKNSKFNKINDFSNKDNYLKDMCAYNCNYFILKRAK